MTITEQYERVKALRLKAHEYRVAALECEVSASILEDQATEALLHPPQSAPERTEPSQHRTVA